MIVYCEYAEEWDDSPGSHCPHTGQSNCFDPVCPMLQTGDAYATDEELEYSDVR